MNRLIDAHDLWSKIQMLPHKGDMISSAEVEKEIVDATTIDAVSVVRCMDCIGYTPVDEHTGKCVFLIGEHQYVVPDGYCYLGERKDSTLGLA